MSQKRIRATNWDEEEKQLLRSVLKDYAQIIENKSIDTNTNKLKLNAWEQVHIKFNQLNSRSRDMTQLKVQWKAMKISARKTCSSFKKEINKTGGGPRPATPNEAIDIKALLNPGELLVDFNIYDSDGVMYVSDVGESEPTCSDSKHVQNEQSLTLPDTAGIQAQDSKHVQNEQSLPLPDTAGIQAQIIQEDTTSITRVVDSIPPKTYEDEIRKDTPIKKSMSTTLAKKDVKRKITMNNIAHSSKKPRKDHEDYVTNIIGHSKILKDDEHLRKMQMAEEDHQIKMEINRENLKCAILEREILELKKAREVLNS